MSSFLSVLGSSLIMIKLGLLLLKILLKVLLKLRSHILSLVRLVTLLIVVLPHLVLLLKMIIWSLRIGLHILVKCVRTSLVHGKLRLTEIVRIRLLILQVVDFSEYVMHLFWFSFLGLMEILAEILKLLLHLIMRLLSSILDNIVFRNLDIILEKLQTYTD